MKTCKCLWLLVLLAFLPTRDAAAHRLVPDDGTHTTAQTAIFLDDPGLSQVVYHTVTPQSNHLWIAFDAASGQNLYWQLGLPAIRGLENYRPTVVVLGPGLPDVELPFPIPEGLGGIILDSTGLPAESFNEHFTGTRDWILHEEDRALTQPGRYYIVAYHPDGTPGKFWLAVGRREAFGLRDILDYADVLAFVRQYHEVQDQTLPILPNLLLLLSKLLRFFANMFGLR
ncbi:MAG TPA: hypothetical protein VMZ06_04725 [Candidatus Bathyarchaeia archaeon]|nr:hypothetical protein [Candidatus Bathyarchaeia archaeon]